MRGKKVFLQNCTLLPPPEKYHPFTSGIVVRKNNEGIFVATVGNLLLLKKVVDDGGSDVTGEIPLGARLYTPGSELDKAMGFEAVYGVKGLEK